MAVFLSVVAVLLFAVAATAPVHVGYYAEYNAVLREIRQRPGLEIVDWWRHEDLTLEDFGFAIRSPRATLMLNIHDNSPIRVPRDRADGIALASSSWGARYFIRFDSTEWRDRKLPRVRTLQDVIANFDAIAYSLITTPPATLAVSQRGDFINLSHRFKKKVSPLPAEPVNSSIFDRIGLWW